MSNSSCVETSDGYVLSGSIPSKRDWCKGRKAKWQPETRTWLFPLSAASSADALVEAYRAADYDRGTRAAHHTKQRQIKAADKAWWDRFEQRKAELIATLTATDEIVKHEDGSGFVNRPVLGYITGPSDDHPEIKPHLWSEWVRPRPGVLVYWLTYD